MTPNYLYLFVFSDTEVATANVTIEGAPALNRVSWTQSGLHVTAGDDSGKIWVFILFYFCLFRFKGHFTDK